MTEATKIGKPKGPGRGKQCPTCEMYFATAKENCPDCPDHPALLKASNNGKEKKPKKEKSEMIDIAQALKVKAFMKKYTQPQIAEIAEMIEECGSYEKLEGLMHFCLEFGK